MQPVAVLPKVLFLLLSLTFFFLSVSRHVCDAFTDRGCIPPLRLILSDPAGATLGNRLGNVARLALWSSKHCSQLCPLSDFCPQSLCLFNSAITDSSISQHTEPQCLTGNLPAAFWPHVNLMDTLPNLNHFLTIYLPGIPDEWCLLCVFLHLNC